MKKYGYLFFLIYATTLTAQHKGNYNQQEIYRANIVISMENAVIYKPAVNEPIHKILNPLSNLTIEVKKLQNVPETSYTAIFNLSQIGETAEEIKIETKHKYYLVAPDGTIDIKELQTDK